MSLYHNTFYKVVILHDVTYEARALHPRPPRTDFVLSTNCHRSLHSVFAMMRPSPQCFGSWCIEPQCISIHINNCGRIAHGKYIVCQPTNKRHTKCTHTHTHTNRSASIWVVPKHAQVRHNAHNGRDYHQPWASRMKHRKCDTMTVARVMLCNINV